MKILDSLVILVDYDKQNTHWKFIVSANDGVNQMDSATLYPLDRQEGWNLVEQMLAPNTRYGKYLHTEEYAWLLAQIQYYRQQQFMNRKVLIVCHYDPQTFTFTARHEDGSFGVIISPPKHVHFITLNGPNAGVAVDLLSIIPF